VPGLHCNDAAHPTFELLHERNSSGGVFDENTAGAIRFGLLRTAGSFERQVSESTFRHEELMSFDGRLLSGASIFTAAVEAGSFAGAGQALGLTSSGISRAIRRLEARLGCSLFWRSANGVRLTPDGAAFYARIGPCLSEIKRAANEISQSSELVRGRLKVVVDAAAGRFVVAPRLNELLDRHPDLSVELCVRDRFNDLASEGAELAVRFGPPRLEGYETRLLFETAVLTCATPAYVERQGAPKVPDDLRTDLHNCILFRDPWTRVPFTWDFRGAGEETSIEVTGRVTVDDVGSLLEAVLSSCGIAQLLGAYCHEFLKRESLVQLLPDWAEERYSLQAIHQAGEELSPRAEAFLAFTSQIGASGHDPHIDRTIARSYFK
jgi:DNA-binding transcriptional LysR family regulator